MTAHATIRRARAAAGGDQLAARLTLERRLGAADWSAPGLPPAAVLCVRRLRARPDRPGAVEAALAAVAARAARPAREFVPVGAEAVWFADAAEWLACLARDAVAGELASRWWWEAVRGNLAGVSAAARAWASAPLFVPAAWKQLAAWGVAAPFALALAPAEASELTRAAVRASGAHVPAAAPTALAHAPTEIASTAPEALALPAGPGRGALAVGLLIARAPHLTRASDTVERVLAWSWSGRNAEPYPAHQSPNPPLVGAGEPPLARADRARSPRVGGGTEEPIPFPVKREAGDARTERTPPAAQTDPLPRAHVVAKPAAETARLSRDSLGAPNGQRPLGWPATDPVPAEPRAVGEPGDEGTNTRSARQAVAAVAPVPTSAGREPGRTPAAEPERVATEFGGLLYLVNVALDLGLYPDFTQPASPGLALSPWDWLALLGREWLGTGFATDPLDGLLATLAGRCADVPPADGVAPPKDWALPATWLPWVEPPAPDEWPALAAWVEWLAPVIARRVSAALGHVEPHAAPGWVLRRRATVLVSPAHLDVVFDLNELAVEIRLALLDRDPGWVPAAGRVIRFRYESHGALP